MKANVRFKANGDGSYSILAIRKDTRKWALFGTCHYASVPLLKKDFNANLHLVKLL